MMLYMLSILEKLKKKVMMQLAPFQLYVLSGYRKLVLFKEEVWYFWVKPLSASVALI